MIIIFFFRLPNHSRLSINYLSAQMWLTQRVCHRVPPPPRRSTWRPFLPLSTRSRAGPKRDCVPLKTLGWKPTKISSATILSCVYRVFFAFLYLSLVFFPLPLQARENAQRQLLYDGSLARVGRKGVVSRHFALFNDCLVQPLWFFFFFMVISLLKQMYGQLDTKFKVRQCIPIATLRVQDITDSICMCFHRLRPDIYSCVSFLSRSCIQDLQSWKVLWSSCWGATLLSHPHAHP